MKICHTAEGMNNKMTAEILNYIKNNIVLKWNNSDRSCTSL